MSRIACMEAKHNNYVPLYGWAAVGRQCAKAGLPTFMSFKAGQGSDAHPACHLTHYLHILSLPMQKMGSACPLCSD